MKAFTTIMTLTTVLVGFAMAAPAPEGAASLFERQVTCETTSCSDDVFCFANRCANGCRNGFCSHP
ncbi:uncharacterized protein PG998_004338 [Apiospora kogelbergensis]|uniref:Uncharacterized protein n=1 Tax=Apiospora kogelbergensis TaxID=1337665 RepID=A0AAW0QG01_9PEZI